MQKKIVFARMSIISNSFLIVIKLIVGLLTGSISIISEAIHSFLDLLASFMTYISVNISETPADKGHPYGHGKFENISGVIEGILIFTAAIVIIIESVKKILGHHIIEKIGLGCLVMLISAIVNFIVSTKLFKFAKETESIALEADAIHLKTDVYASLAIGTGLLLIWLTGLQFLDPIVAILVAVFIIWESVILIINAFSPLVDTSLSDRELKIINDLLQNKSLTYHDLKTRKAGSDRFVDLHLEMPQDMPLKDVHKICDEIEAELSLNIKNLQINIHAEPLETKMNTFIKQV